MVYLLETEISNTKQIRKSLRGIYGLGKKNTKLICNKLGLAKNVNISELSRFQVNKITEHIETFKIPVTSNLKKTQSLATKNLINIKTVRGLRRLRGLPVRGQRTHTNAKNARFNYQYEINIQIKQTCFRDVFKIS